MENAIYIERDFGWFLGCFDNNRKHRHYAIQLSIPINGFISVELSEKVISTESPVLIKPNISHRITSDAEQFLLLINPASTIGHFWNKIADTTVSEIDHPFVAELQATLNDGAMDIDERRSMINGLIRSYDCFCDSFIHRGDDRINKALGYLANHINRVVSLDEIAGICAISPDRFLHLFRGATGMTYRRAQLWARLTDAIPLMNNYSLTETAHQAGFADSAHFSRTFRENFGFSPRQILKFSRFIQV
ncbi:helix-turn-helix domain-containing protein [Marinilabilia salmonicolor]|uniref:helix-turn-helix domain-containing protein n=1 Tax=Marinilabilia salmonicolor TaxID=989 RepID=UPI00029AE57D|nr:AraC family transcriptional regulator [Marinilabilia salmonicolor]